MSDGPTVSDRFRRFAPGHISQAGGTMTTSATTNAELPLVSMAQGHGDRIAIVDPGGTHTYADLLSASERVAGTLLANGGAERRRGGGTGREDLGAASVAVLTPADSS